MFQRAPNSCIDTARAVRRAPGRLTFGTKQICSRRCGGALELARRDNKLSGRGQGGDAFAPRPPALAWQHY